MRLLLASVVGGVVAAAGVMLIVTAFGMVSLTDALSGLVGGVLGAVIVICVLEVVLWCQGR